MTDRNDPPRAGERARAPLPEDDKIEGEREEEITISGSKRVPNKFEVVSMTLTLPSGEEVILGGGDEDRPTELDPTQ